MIIYRLIKGTYLSFCYACRISAFCQNFKILKRYNDCDDDNYDNGFGYNYDGDDDFHCHYDNGRFSILCLVS